MYHATFRLTFDVPGVLASTPSTPELAQQEILVQISLCRLRRGQWKEAESRRVLGEGYGKFSKGIATAELIETKRVLDEG